LVEVIGVEDDVGVIREALKLATLAVLQDNLGGVLAVEIRFGGLKVVRMLKVTFRGKTSTHADVPLGPFQVMKFTEVLDEISIGGESFRDLA